MASSAVSRKRRYGGEEKSVVSSKRFKYNKYKRWFFRRYGNRRRYYGGYRRRYGYRRTRLYRTPYYFTNKKIHTEVFRMADSFISCTTQDTDLIYPNTYYVQAMYGFTWGAVANWSPLAPYDNWMMDLRNQYEYFRVKSVTRTLWLDSCDQLTTDAKDRIPIMLISYDQDARGRTYKDKREYMGAPQTRRILMKPGEVYKFTLYPVYDNLASFDSKNATGNPTYRGTSQPWFKMGEIESGSNRVESANCHQVIVFNGYNGMKINCAASLTIQFKVKERRQQYM